MTATVPDVETIEHLDFEPEVPVPCKHPRCSGSATPHPACQVLVVAMPCNETHRLPICSPCSGMAEYAILTHIPITCERHQRVACAHDVFSFEALR